MPSVKRRGFFRTTIVGGVFFLVPLVVVVAILEKALALLDKVTTPLARLLAVHDLGGVPAPRLFAVVILIAICFLAGLLAKTRIARHFVDTLETNVLSNIPGYSFLKKVGESVAGVEGRDAGPTVLARIEDAWQLGFLMERLQDGHLVVFVPGAPDASSGSVYVMTPERVRFLDVPMAEAFTLLRRLGRGWKVPIPPETPNAGTTPVQ